MQSLISDITVFILFKSLTAVSKTSKLLMAFITFKMFKTMICQTKVMFNLVYQNQNLVEAYWLSLQCSELRQFTRAETANVVTSFFASVNEFINLFIPCLFNCLQQPCVQS